MPDVPADGHAQIVNELDGMRLDMVGLRDTTDVKAGYRGFDLAETTLLNCRGAIEVVRDRDQIVSMLKGGNVALRGGQRRRVARRPARAHSAAKSVGKAE
jgi:hypothetical protein